MSDKRTTVVLDDEDQATLTKLAQVLRSSEMEAIRRSIRLARQVMQWQEEGKMIQLIVGDRERWTSEAVLVDADAKSIVIVL